MFGKIFLFILKLITELTTIILSPLDSLISTYLPDLANVLTSITQFMNLPISVMGWVFELVHIPTTLVALFVVAFISKYAIITASAGVKYVLTLYQRLKP